MYLVALCLVCAAIYYGIGAMKRRLTPLARRLMPAADRVSAADREAAAAVWRVLGAVVVTAGVVAGVAWYFERGPLEPWMLAAYFAWGVTAYLILDHTLDRRLRSGWLRNTARVLLVACFAWTLVAPWRLLGRLSDWYFERHPVGSFPMFSLASADEIKAKRRLESIGDSLADKHLMGNINYEGFNGNGIWGD